MELYQDFLDRINGFETPELQLGDGDFRVSPSVAAKVSEENAFQAFYGDTVVFDLSAQEKEVIRSYVEILYREVPECFCERLADNTFHLTLHDLCNSPVLQDVTDQRSANEQKLKAILSEQPVRHQTIQMRSKAVFNMVNTSLVMGFCPVNEPEYRKLMALYERIDAVTELPYPLTPHITLAYYNRSGFGHSAAERLTQTVNSLNTDPLEITLDTSRLQYQHFRSMNDYRCVFCLENNI